MRVSRHLPVALLVAIVACGDTAAPTVADVAGIYTATSLTTQDSGGTTNWLTQGSSLGVTLDADGVTTGHLFVPGGNDSGGDLNADLAGTWVLHGDTVEFDQVADTFVRDMPFVFADNQLTGNATFSGTTVHVVLAKH